MAEPSQSMDTLPPMQDRYQTIWFTSISSGVALHTGRPHLKQANKKTETVVNYIMREVDRASKPNYQRQHGLRYHYYCCLFACSNVLLLLHDARTLCYNYCLLYDVKTRRKTPTAILPSISYIPWCAIPFHSRDTSTAIPHLELAKSERLSNTVVQKATTKEEKEQRQTP